MKTLQEEIDRSEHLRGYVNDFASGCEFALELLTPLFNAQAQADAAAPDNPTDAEINAYMDKCFADAEGGACDHCAHSIAETDHYCSQCGSPVNGASAPVEPEPLDMFGRPAQPDYVGAQDREFRAKRKRANKRQSKKESL